MRTDREKLNTDFVQRITDFEILVQKKVRFVMAASLLIQVIILGYCMRRLSADAFFAAILLLLLVSALLYGYFMYWLHRQFMKLPDMETEYRQGCDRAKALRIQAEMHALQSQINPHFLYNTLENIRAIALSRDEADIAKVVEALSDMFRYSISRPRETATLQEELENIKNYLLIQKQRFPDKIHYHAEIEDPKAFMYRLPVLTLQPIIENAVSHGLEPKRGTGSISVHVFLTDYHIVIRVADDGIGMDEKTLALLRSRLEGNTPDTDKSTDPYTRGAGIALMNVDRRLKFYFGKEYGLDVMSTKDVGTIVEVTLPNYETRGSSCRKDPDGLQANDLP